MKRPMIQQFNFLPHNSNSCSVAQSQLFLSVFFRFKSSSYIYIYIYICTHAAYITFFFGVSVVFINKRRETFSLTHYQWVTRCVVSRPVWSAFAIVSLLLSFETVYSRPFSESPSAYTHEVRHDQESVLLHKGKRDIGFPARHLKSTWGQRFFLRSGKASSRPGPGRIIHSHCWR